MIVALIQLLNGLQLGVLLFLSAAGLTLRSARHRARGARMATRGLGMTLGAWGYEYQEYRRKES